MNDPLNFEPDWNVIECGAEILALREEDGVLIVTTAKGTFPIDPRFFDDVAGKVT